MRAGQIPTTYSTVSGAGILTASNSPLYSMRRRELYQLADAWGVEYAQDTPATEMRKMFMERGISGFDGAPNEKQNAIKAESRKPVEITQENEPSVPLAPYDEWKFLDLRKECKRRGIPYVNTDKKHVLLEKLAPSEVIYGQIAS